MSKLLKDLVLALVNATLLLIAVCLFLAWRMSSTVDGMVATIAGNLEIVAPLRDDVRDLTGEIAALRADLATLKTEGGEIGSDAMQTVQDRVVRVETRIDRAGARIDDLLAAPGQLVDRAVAATMQTAATEFTRAVNDIRGCEPVAR